MPTVMASDSQYQHFVPQFLLRNFAYDFVLPDDPETHDGEKKKKKKKKKNWKNKASYDKGNLKKYPGDKVVKNVNLLQTPYVIDESPVKRILGKLDMYRDNNKPTKEEQNEVERMFSHIENEAQKVFRRITKAYGEGDQTISLTRTERDLVRKFLFLLKFRGFGFYNRFSHEDIESYSADDKELFQKYMRDNNFTRPVEIWLRSLKIFMDLKMDPERKWIDEVRKRIFRLDAEWFIEHVQSMYMAICTPESTQDEFILTDNSYNIFEGPNHFARDIDTGVVYPASYVDFHDFAPISSKIMIVLRSFILPVPEEDKDPKIRRMRENTRYIAVEDIFGPDTKSVLEDLPIAKARNNYTYIVDGRVVRNNDFTEFSHKDKFYFQFFPLKTHDVNKINKILLENTYTCSRIVFRSEKAFLRTLEWYMTQPKIVMGINANLQEKHLQRLDALMTAMGSTKKSTWTPVQPPPIIDGERQRMKFNTWSDSFFDSTKNVNLKGHFFSRYKNLDDTGHADFFTDVEQSGRMRILRIKIDSWSQLGVDEAIRERNRTLLTEAYKRQPPPRFWLYMKRTRLMLMNPEHVFMTVQPLVEILSDPRFRDGPEDVFAEVKKWVRPNRLNHLIYATAMVETQLAISEMNIWQPAPDFIEEFLRYEFLANYVLALPGRIRNCGLPEVEKVAVAMEKQAVRQKMHRQKELAGWKFPDDDKIEILTRIMVRGQFKTVLPGMDAELAQRLEDAFFTYTYPTPPTKD